MFRKGRVFMVVFLSVVPVVILALQDVVNQMVGLPLWLLATVLFVVGNRKWLLQDDDFKEYTGEIDQYTDEREKREKKHIGLIILREIVMFVLVVLALSAGVPEILKLTSFDQIRDWRFTAEYEKNLIEPTTVQQYEYDVKWTAQYIEEVGNEPISRYFTPTLALKGYQFVLQKCEIVETLQKGQCFEEAKMWGERYKLRDISEARAGYLRYEMSLPTATPVPTQTPLPTPTKTATPQKPTAMPILTQTPLPTRTPLPGEVNCYATYETEDLNPPLGKMVVINKCISNDFYRVEWYPPNESAPYYRLVNVGENATFVWGQKSVTIVLEMKEGKIKIRYN